MATTSKIFLFYGILILLVNTFFWIQPMKFNVYRSLATSLFPDRMFTGSPRPGCLRTTYSANLSGTDFFFTVPWVWLWHSRSILASFQGSYQCHFVDYAALGEGRAASTNPWFLCTKGECHIKVFYFDLHILPMNSSQKGLKTTGWRLVALSLTVVRLKNYYPPRWAV